MSADTVGTIYEILSANLMVNNIGSSQARLDCARAIADVIGRNPSMEAPRNGVLLHYSKGNGRVDLVVKSDPPLGNGKTLARVMKSLEETIGDLK